MKMFVIAHKSLYFHCNKIFFFFCIESQLYSRYRKIIIMSICCCCCLSSLARAAIVSVYLFYSHSFCDFLESFPSHHGLLASLVYYKHSIFRTYRLNCKKNEILSQHSFFSYTSSFSCVSNVLDSIAHDMTWLQAPVRQNRSTKG